MVCFDESIDYIASAGRAAGIFCSRLNGYGRVTLQAMDHAVLRGFVAFDENRFFGESPPLVARHVNHHGDPVHYASTGDFPGKLPAAPCMAQLAIRDKALSALLACTVVSDPPWPVLRACSRSAASPPRTSPTTM